MMVKSVYTNFTIIDVLKYSLSFYFIENKLILQVKNETMLQIALHNEELILFSNTYLIIWFTNPV